MDRIYFKNGEKKVHYTLENLKIKGNLYDSDLIWYEGLPTWKKASEIEELKLISLSTPPLTSKELKIKNLKYSIKTCLITYCILSLFVGVSSGLLEKYQYDVFAEKIKESSDKEEKKEKAFIAKNKTYNTFDSEEGLSSLNTSKEEDFSINEWTNLTRDETSVQNEDGTYYTRWSKFMTTRYFDNEQVSYNYSHKFLFRPYKAFFGHVNLSKEERESSFLLISNFTMSSFVSNLILIPFLILIFFKSKRSK